MIGVVIWFAFVGFIVFRAIAKGKEIQGQNQNRPLMPRPQQVQQPVTQQSVVDQLQQQRVAQQQKRQMQQQATQGSILARAKANARALEDDTTLTELEESHGHSAHVESTGALTYQAQQKEAHPHDAAHVAAELEAQEGQLLASVEDLMVKGYDGTLSFERDFLGEGMDMIARFTLQPITSNIETSNTGV